ncbi:MAG: aldose 1-epimerase family protein [Coprococcus sp.]
MEKVKLENQKMVVLINSFGAELSSIVEKNTKVEYMWNADERYWKRNAPVLFPIVGSLKNKEYLYEGKAYPMGQHGFARDMEFEVISVNDTEAWFGLRYNEETLEKYPFKFYLQIGYKLSDNKINVLWKVVNEDNKDMYFSIGGHPAFMCPLAEGEKQSDYSLKFDTKNDLTYSLLSANGLVEREGLLLKNNNGSCCITSDMFDNDALIIEGNQAHEVSLVKPDGTAYLTVTFDAPLFGLWSPAKKNAPFICIEPWYGRCDKESFSGTLEDREYSNKLMPGETFEKNYTIKID